MKKLRVLFITPTPVDDRSFGGAIRSSDLRRALMACADVDALVVQGGPEFLVDADWDAERVRNVRHTAHGVSLEAWQQTRRVRRVVADILAAQHYDLIVVRYLGQAMFVPKGEWRKRLVIDPDDVYKSLADPHAASLSARLKCRVRNEVVARMLRHARHVWIVNPADAARLKLQRTSMLGNVVVVPALVRPRVPAKPGRILMVGFFPHPPNAEGLRWFAREVMPALLKMFPEAQLHAVGKRPPGVESNDTVVVRGYVDDVAAEYARASLVIAPIFAGAGSQIKVIDALANERPLLTSTFALQGFAALLHPGVHLQVADTPSEWIERCASVLRDGRHAEAMAARGYEVVKANFGFDAMVAGVRATLAAVDAP